MIRNFGVITACAGLATASLSYRRVRRRSGVSCAASAVAHAALHAHRQYKPLQVPAAEAGPQSPRRLPLPVFEPPSFLSLRVPPPPVRRRVQPLLGLELDAAAHWPTLRLVTVVQCLRATRRVSDALLLPCTALALQVPRVLRRLPVAALPVPRMSRPRRLRSARLQKPT